MWSFVPLALLLLAAQRSMGTDHLAMTLATTRSKPRRTTAPRCVIQRCNKPARTHDLCRKHAMDKADRLAREIVMQRDKGCRASTHSYLDEDGGVILGPCGGGLQWCHVWSRSYHVIRHDPRNAVVLCRDHHAFMGNHPAQWEQWCRDHGIPWDTLRLEALHGAASWSLDTTLDRLMA